MGQIRDSIEDEQKRKDIFSSHRDPSVFYCLALLLSKLNKQNEDKN